MDATNHPEPLDNVYVEEEFGHYEMTLRRFSREDLILFCTILENAEHRGESNEFINGTRLEIESFIMEVN
jgi:hypothetical protein